MNKEIVEPKLLPVIERRYLSVKTSFSLKKDDELIIEKLSSVHTTRDFSYIDISNENAIEKARTDGRELIKSAASTGYDALFEKSSSVWKSFWKNQDIEIDGRDSFDQLGVRFALYHLTIMTKSGDTRLGVPAKGLSGEDIRDIPFGIPKFLYSPIFYTPIPLLQKRF